MNCQVYGCRYSHCHLTENHICGKCHKSGHGKVECGHPSKIKNLEKYYTQNLQNTSNNILSEHQLNNFCSANIIKSLLPCGSYTEVYGGMGSTIFVRNIGATIQGILIGNQDWSYNPSLINEKDEFIKNFNYLSLSNEQMINATRNM